MSSIKLIEIKKKGKKNTARKEEDFKRLCYEGNLDEVKKIIISENFPFTILDEGFILACEGRSMKVIKFLDEYCSERAEEFDYHEAMITSCLYGHYDVVKWIWQNKEIDLHQNNDEIFHICIENQFLDVTQYIYNLDKKYYRNLVMNEDENFANEALKEAIRRESLDYAKWIRNTFTGKIDLHYEDDVFIRMTENEKIKQWLELLSK